MSAIDTQSEETPRERIVASAAHLLERGGRDAVSTRAVSAAAGIQAPTIYRLFGDKQGLLDAVATAGFIDYLANKTSPMPTDDPVEDLRTGWDLHVELGVAKPALYTLMYDEHRPRSSPAARAAIEVLTTRIRRIATAGRLRVTERRAVDLVHAAGHGTTLILIATPEDERDPDLSRLAREAIIAAITTDTPPPTTPHQSPGLVNAAVTFRAMLPITEHLTDAESTLMQEWLERILATSAQKDLGCGT